MKDSCEEAVGEAKEWRTEEKRESSEEMEGVNVGVGVVEQYVEETVEERTGSVYVETWRTKLWEERS